MAKRPMPKQTLWGWVLCGVLTLAGVSASAICAEAPAGVQAPGGKPNIVYILADDMGWKDVGFHGSDIKTPSIDKLAQGGARLEQFYAQPMCTPSRAALMTGRYPHRYGLQTAVILSAGKYGLPTDEFTLAQALKQAGYKTAIVGKWHLGHAKKEFWPKQRGFDHQYGPLLGEIDYFTHSAHGTRDWFRNNEPVVETGYVTSLLGQEAVRLIEAHDPKTPLFLYLTFTAPHAPYQAPQEYLDQYKDVTDPNRRAYSAMVTAMDVEIGRVIEALEKKGMLENTLIVFQSDNGGPRSAKMTGEVDTSKGAIPADNGRYREGKGTLYEGGTRVVALAHWRGKISEGSVVEQPIHIVDMYPTLAKLAGVSTGQAKPLDGVDVWSTLSAGSPSPRNEIVYGVEPFRSAVREGDWKLVWRTVLPSQIELFNLAEDPLEKNNLAAKFPDKVKALQAKAEAQARESAKPLFLLESFQTAWSALTETVALPLDAQRYQMEP